MVYLTRPIDDRHLSGPGPVSLADVPRTSASRPLHVGTGHDPSNSCIEGQLSRFERARGKLPFHRYFAMTWFRAFVLSITCLLVSAAACSGGQFSAAEDTGMPAVTSAGSSTSTDTVDTGAGGATTGSTGVGGSAGTSPDGGTPACKTCADLH